MPKSKRQYEDVVIPSIAGGIVDSRDGVLLRDSQSPTARNVEFNRDSAKHAQGGVKFNNQVAPKPGLLTTVDPAFSRLAIAANQSVPVRGYGYIPYDKEIDIGGDFVEVIDGAKSDPFDRVRHTRRGQDFDIQISFKIPETEKLYERDSRGDDAPAFGSEGAGYDVNAGAADYEVGGGLPWGYNEGLDEFTSIVQKGGDRTALMSWSLGIVNTGHAFDIEVNGGGNSLITGAAPAARPSNYALCFTWFDDSGWGGIVPANFKYSLDTEADVDTNGEVGTMAYRAVVFERFLEPGRTYHVSLQVKLDTGSASYSTGSGLHSTSWNDDGAISLFVREEEGALESYRYVDHASTPVNTGVYNWKGPDTSTDDTREYLCKYGVRYSAKDATFLGLGHRFSPYNDNSWIPLGADAAPLERAGYRMLDRSVYATSDVYDTYDLTATHAGTDAFITVSHNSLRATGLELSPANPFEASGTWTGVTNTRALEGYRLVLDAAHTAAKGAILTLHRYTEVGGPVYRFNVEDGANLGAFTTESVFIQCFRWHQRPLVLSEFRVYAGATQRDFVGANAEQTARNTFSLRSEALLEDDTEFGIEYLRGRWPLDDGGGGVLRETVANRCGFTAPFGLGTTDQGARGSSELFISGEGEAPKLHLQDNPIVQREMERLLASGVGGFAIEITMRIPEAYYAIPVSGASTIAPTLVPYLASWEVDADIGEGATESPAPLMRFGHRPDVPSVSLGAFLDPVGFSLEVGESSDQAEEVTVATVPFVLPDGTGMPLHAYGNDAPWVGRRVTIQFGVQSAGAEDEFNCYIACLPKEAFKPADGDGANQEYTVFTSSAGPSGVNTTIRKKDLARSVITIGGVFDPGTLGYSEVNARLILDEVRVFGCAAPGKLPTTATDLSTVATYNVQTGKVDNRDGKLDGACSLPQRRLSASDILQPLGPSLRTANVTDGSVTVTPPGSTSFFTAEPEATCRAIRETFLLVSGDRVQLRERETEGTEQEEFYYIDSVAADGSTLALATPFADTTRDNATAASFRLIGYTAFADSQAFQELSLGRGKSFTPGASVLADVVETRDLFFNLAPVTGNFRYRIWSPLGYSSAAEILPRWVRGLVSPRKNPILGLKSLNETIYAAARGSMFIADDRWREDGPLGTIGESLTETKLRRSLRLYGDRDPESNVIFPRARDWVEFTDLSSVTMTSASFDSTNWGYDCWIYLDEVGKIQTLLWCGNVGDNPEMLAGAGASLHRMHYWVRFNNGAPEFVIGSTGVGASGAPEKGLFTARADVQVPVGRWFHQRWWVYKDAGGGVSAQYSLNGKKVDVAYNVLDTGVTPEWVDRTNIVQPGTGAVLVVGAAHDSLDAREGNTAFVKNKVQGDIHRPTRTQGMMHGLGGRFCGLVVINTDSPSDPITSYFDPFNITYGSPFMQVLQAGVQDGLGHKVEDEIGLQFGTIFAHPLMSVSHELGTYDEPFSFATFGSSMYAAFGGRPLRIDGERARFAGVLAPSTRPTFTIERRPLWEPNVYVAGGAGNDPVEQGLASDGDKIAHFSSFGNNYVKGVFADDMLWTKTDDTGATDYFGFKCWVKMRSTAGIVPLYSSRSGLDSGGPFVELHNGALVVGWYDTYTKQRHEIRTNTRAVVSGEWHYINVRKRYHPDDEDEGHWLNSRYSSAKLKRATIITTAVADLAAPEIISGSAHTGIITRVYDIDATANTATIEYLLTSAADFADTNAITGGTSGGTAVIDGAPIHPSNDLAIVRRAMQVAPSATYSNHPTFSLTTVDAVGAGTVHPRNCISFTEENLSAPAGTTATGVVSFWNGLTFSDGVTDGGGGADEVFFQTTGLNGLEVFHEDMVGMYWQWATGATAAVVGPVYRIIAVDQAGQSIQVVDEDGAAPTFSESAEVGAVFSGVSMVKGVSFDESQGTDEAVYDIECFGSQLAFSRFSGVSRFDGEFNSFAYVVISSTTDEDVGLFEDPAEVFTPADGVEQGTDYFSGQLYGTIAPLGTAPGELLAAPGQVFFCSHTQPYADPGATVRVLSVSSQPNETLEIVGDDESSSSANSMFWRSLEQVDLLSGVRRVAVAFYDPSQDQVSNPGPELVIFPSNEDRSNPSAQARFLLTDLPVSREGSHIERWIYITLSDGNALFRVAVLKDNSSTSVSVFSSENEITRGEILSRRNFAPPEASLVAVSQSVMFYGRLKLQPEGMVYSQPARPGATPAENYVLPASGRGDEITGMGDHKGRLLFFKRDITYRGIVRFGAFIYEVLSTGVGCVAHQSFASLDSYAMWLGDRGPYGYRSSGVPEWIGHNIEDFFVRDLDASVDKLKLRFASGAINRARNQYVVALKREGDDRARVRITAEFDHEYAGSAVQTKWPAAFRFGVHDTPAITALGVTDRAGGGVERFIGGTDDGFVVWLDRDETTKMMLGPSTDVHGLDTLARTDPPGIYGAQVDAGQVDLALEGPRGAMLRWKEAGGNFEQFVLFASTDRLHYDARDTGSRTPTSVYTLGAQRPQWDSKWFSMNAPHLKKKLHYVDVVFRPKLSGTVTIQCFVDFDETADQLETTGTGTAVARTFSLVGDGSVRVELGAVKQAKHFKFNMLLENPAVGVDFELTQLVIRFSQAEQS